MSDSLPDLPSADPDFLARFEEAAPALYVWAALRIRPSLRRRMDPEDLVQEVGLRALSSLHSFDPARGSFRGWIFGIAHVVLQRAVMDLFRVGPAGAEPDATAGAGLDAIALQTTTIARKAGRREQVQALLQAAAGLGEEERRLLVDRGLLGLRHAELAERLGVTVAVVEKRWQRLRDRLLRETGATGVLCA